MAFPTRTDTDWTEPRLRDLVRAHGGEPDALLLLDRDSADLLPYATLRDARRAHPADLGSILGIYEWQGAPLMVLVDGDDVDDARLQRIRRAVALRGDVPYIGLLAGGRLDVYVVALAKGPVGKVELAVHVSVVLPYVAVERPLVRPLATTVSKVVLKLLNDALETLVDTCGLAETDAISLAGRALFARFLADRDLPLGPHLDEGGSGEAFANPTMAKATSLWLQRNFNGNLLPMDEAVFDTLPPEGFGVLIDVMRRAPGGQLSLGWEQRWDNLHFAYIPVGILSQVYEQYLKQHEEARQRNEGSYYTPAPIADLMVRAALEGVPFERRHAARVLDPAAGAGVFLITAFRRLVAERWRHDGVRPTTPVLREILYGQIAGFDVNEASLRFAALGLYLVSIELDPEPEPISKLAFEDLRGLVLHRPTSEETITAGNGDETSLGKLGSLGPGVGAEHLGRYDVVIGNPPWKTGSGLKGWKWVEAHTRALATARLAGIPRPSGDQPEPGHNRQIALLPNEAMDLPFVWRATEWAREGGQIAFALHARLLFQQNEGMPEARAALFEALDVTSVINGAGLRKTRVWPQISAPFCLLFARNRIAGPAAAVRFVSPLAESGLLRSGVLRIDAARAPLVRVEEMLREPEQLKILFRGSELDLDIWRRVVGAGHPTLRETVHRGDGTSGAGLQRLRPSSRIRVGQELPGADASYLKGLPFLAKGDPDLLIETAGLPLFDEDRIHDPRRPEIFRGPLLVVGKVARANVRGLSAGVAEADVAYSENYYGYGLDGHPEGSDTALYGAVILRSGFARWWMLMTSGEYGFEREVIEKAAIDALPVPPLASLAPRLRDELHRLAADIRAFGARADHDALDEWIGALYGLTPSNAKVIKDTLAYGLSDVPAQHVPIDAKGFAAGVAEELAPWRRRLGSVPEMHGSFPGPTQSWHFAVIGRHAVDRAPGDEIHSRLAGFVQAADATGSTEIYHDDGKGRMWIGLQASPRHWTYSQGIRAARHLLWNHMGFLAGGAGERAHA